MAAFCGSVAGRWRPAWCTATDSEAAHAAVAGLRVAFVRALLAYDAGKLEDAQRVLTACLGYVEKGAVSLDGAWARAPGPTHSDVVPRASKEAMSRVLQSIKLRLLVGTQQEETVASPTPVRRGLAQLRSLIDTTSGRPPLAEMDADSELFGRTVADLKQAVASADDLSESDKCRLSVMAATVPLCASLADEDKMVQAAVVWARPDAPAPAWARWAREAARDLQPFAASLFSAAHGALSDQDRAVLAQARSGLLRAVATVPATPQMEDTAWQVEAASNALSCVLLLSLADKSVARNASKVIKMALGVVLAAHVSPFPPALTGVHRLALDVGATVMSVYEQCVSDMQSAEPSPALTPDHGKPLTQEDDGDSDSDGPLDSSALCTSLRRLRRPELHALRPWLTALVSSAVNTVSEADMREPPEVAGLPSEVLPPVTPLWSLGGPAERGGRHTLNNNVVIGTQHQDARLYNAAEVIATTLPRTHGRLMWSAVTAHLDAADPSVDKVTALEGAGSPFRIAVLAMLGTSAMGLKEALQRCAELELRITALLQHDGGADAVASAVRTWPAASLATSVGTSVLAPGVQAPAAVRPEAAQGAPSALPDGVEELLRWHAGAGEAAGDGGKEGSGGTILPGTVDVSDMEALAEACALQGAVLAARAKSKRERERAAAPDRVLAPALGNLMPAAVMSNSPGGQEEAPDATQAPATLSTPLRWMVMAIACAPWTAHGWAGMQAILGDLAQHMWADGVAVLARDPTSIRNALGHKSYLAEFDDLPRQLHAASRLLNWAVLCGRIANEVAARWRSPGSDAALRKELGALHRRQQMILFCATRTGAPFMGAKGYPRFPVQIPYVQPGTRAKMLYEALASFAAAQQHLPPPAGSTEAWLLPFLAGVCALDLWNSKARGSPDPLPLLSQSVLASCERRRNKGDHDEKGDEGDTATENADDAAAASPPLLVPFHALHAARLDVLLMLKDSPSGAWHASADIAGMLHSVAQAGFVPGAITAKDRDAMWGEALKDIQAAMVGILASQARFSPARATLARCIAARGSEEDISEAAEQLAVDGGHVLHTFTLRGRGARSGGPTRVLVTPHEWLTRTFRGAQIPAEDGGPSPGPTAGSAGLRPERLEGGFPAPGASGVGLWWATSAGQDTVALLVQLLVAADRAEELVDIVAFWHGTETLQQGMGLRVELPVYGARTDRPPRLYDDLMFGALGLAAWLVRVRCKQEQDTTVESQDTTIEVSASERLVKFYLAWAHKWEAMSGTVAHAMITALGEGTPRSGSEVIEAAMREAIKPNWADAGRWWPITCVANLAHRAGLASPPGPDAPQRDKIQALEESGGAAFLKLALTYLDRTLPELKDPLGRLVSLLPEMRGLVPPPPGQAPGASSAPRQGEVLYPAAGQLLVRFHDIVLAGVRAALGEMDIDFLGVPVTLLPDAPFPAPEDEAWKIWEDCVDSRKTKTSATQLDQALRPLLQKLDSLRGRLDLDFVARAVEQRDGKPSELQPVVARLVVALAVSGAIVGTMKIRSEANELRQELAAERKAAEDDGKPAAAVEARTKPLIERIEEADAVWHRLHGMIGQCRTLYNDLKQQGDVAAAPGTCRLEANPLCSLGARSDAAVVLAPFKSSLRDRLRRLVDALTKPRCWGARDSLRVGIKARAPARRTDAGAAAQEAPDAEPAAVGRAGARGAARSPADTDSRTEAANIVIEVLDIVCKASRGALMMVNETVIAAGPVPTR
ncbi:unnamed protein product [Pedinophyceae sp. YPF-701]|nr:unnamed protein product [Pedinophyceae sp. YPF-701]